MVKSLSRTFAVIVAQLLLLSMVPGIAAAQAKNCPQPRFTGQAPADYLAKTNPMSDEAASLAAAEPIFMGKNRAANCVACHGAKGDGRGVLASQFDPPPRDFTCTKTIEGVPDGQLFWIIKFGSPGTAMPPHKRLSEEQIWQLVLYLRHLSK